MTVDPLVTALLSLAALGLVIGAVLGYASVRFAIASDPVIEKICNVLPQTQCGQCGYPGCRPYAEAVAAGDAINKCPPGGEATITALAELLGVEPVALDAEYGVERPKAVAFIREEECIGCVKCIEACPVDAIVGAAKMMHTVIASECTGCDLCVDPCPVDCIKMIPLATTIQGGSWDLPVPLDLSAQRSTTPERVL